MKPIILANTSSPDFMVNPDNIKIWLGAPDGSDTNKPCKVVLSASPAQALDINLSLVRIAGRVDCESCENYGDEIPDPSFGERHLGGSDLEIEICQPGSYYLFGTRHTAAPLLNSRCDPIIIELVPMF